MDIKSETQATSSDATPLQACASILPKLSYTSRQNYCRVYKLWGFERTSLFLTLFIN